MSIPEIQGRMDPYVKQLGLTWEIMYSFEPVTDARILSSKDTRRHIIGLPQGVSIDELHGDIVNHLVLAKFAEKYDPLFATARFHPDYDINDETFRFGARMLQYSWNAVADVWESDEIEKMDKKLSGERLHDIHDLVLKMPYEGFGEQDMIYLMVVGVSARFAQAKRLGREQDIKEKHDRVMAKFGEYLPVGSMDTVQKLTEALEVLPRLPEDR